MTRLQAKVLIVLLSIVAAVLVGAALRATYLITMPFVFGFFVAVLVWPVYDGMRRRMHPKLWWVSLSITMLGILVVLAGFFGAAWFAIYSIAGDEMDAYVEQANRQWQELTRWLQQRGLPAPGDVEAGEMIGRIADMMPPALMTVGGWIVALVLTFFFVLLMLYEADHYHNKSREAMTSKHWHAALDAMGAIAQQVRNFLMIQAFIAFITALATGAWLWFMGVPFVALWILLTFLLDFVPIVGPNLAGALTSVVALLTLGWGPAIITAIGLLAIQQFFGNFIDPLLKGHRMSISPIVLLVAVIFWSWVWGPAGAVLAVPIAATIIIAMAHVRELRPIALMLSRTADREKFEKQTTAPED